MQMIQYFDFLSSEVLLHMGKVLGTNNLCLEIVLCFGKILILGYWQLKTSY